MRRSWLGIGALALAIVAGCDETESKKAEQKANDVGKKSFEGTRGAAGVAPPDMLQLANPSR